MCFVAFFLMRAGSKDFAFDFGLFRICNLEKVVGGWRHDRFRDATLEVKLCCAMNIVAGMNGIFLTGFTIISQ
jgi:hypothetical protein